jgi:hypothetical protein
MKLQYTLSAQDYLDYYLFTASQSPSIRKKLQNERVILLLITVAFGIYFYATGKVFMAVIFGLWAIAGELWFPQYFRYRYKKHYEKFILENYAKRIGAIINLEIQEDAIYSNDQYMEGKFFLSKVEKIEETPAYFYVKLNIGSHFIIPKKSTQQVDELRNTLKARGLTIVEHPNWRWEKW